MFISRLTMPLENKETQRRLVDAYKMHQTIMGGFKEYDDKGRILYRIEPETDFGKLRILIQSPVKPDWSHLEAFVDIDGKELDLGSVILQNHRFLFRLRANPIVTRKGKRYGLIGESAQRLWLEKKSCGMAFEDYRVIDEGHVISQKGLKKVFYKSVRYEGLLRITDKQKALESITNGIGPAKGFGFGLLSLARG